MRICPYCGSPTDDDSRFCGNCGAALPVYSSAERQPFFCPNCGEKLTADSAFCPNCGTAVQRMATPTPPLTQMPQQQMPPQMPPAPAKKTAAGGKIKPCFIGIAAAVVVVIALVAVAVKIVPGLFSTPDKQFISYQKDLFTTELLSAMEGGLNRYGSGSFSTDMTITASVDNPDINSYLANFSINLGIDLKKDSLVASGELVLMGSPILNATATYDDGKFGFLLPQADNNYYVIDLEKVIKNLSGEDVDLGAPELPEISGKQVRSLTEAYLDLVYSTITKDNVTMEKDKNVRLSGLGSSFTGTVYTFTPTAEDIENLMTRLAARLEKDKDLRDLILQMIGSEAMVQLMDDYIPSGYSLEDELDEALLEAAKELRNEAQRIGRQVEDSGFTWVLAVEGNTVRQIRLSVQNPFSWFSGDLVYEAEGAESSGRSELVYLTNGDVTMNVLEHSYTKNGNIYNGRVSVYDYSDSGSYHAYVNTLTIDYRMDRGNTSVFGIPYGEYSLTIDSYGETLSVSLKVADGAGGGVDHIFSINADSRYFNHMFSRLSLTINATDRSSVKKPSQRAVDISDYSEEELYDLFYGIGYALGNELIYNSPLARFLYGW